MDCVDLLISIMENKKDQRVDSCESFDAIMNWEEEAAGIIRDVQDHVNFISVSRILKSKNYEIFLNIKTIENNAYCIRVSTVGFEIVGYEFDKYDKSNYSTETYETPYALLTAISPGYIQSFGNKLSEKLKFSFM